LDQPPHHVFYYLNVGSTHLPTYLPTYLPACLPTYLPTNCLRTNLPTCPLQFAFCDPEHGLGLEPAALAAVLRIVAGVLEVCRSVGRSVGR
jgi:hypothetical protein